MAFLKLTKKKKWALAIGFFAFLSGTALLLNHAVDPYKKRRRGFPNYMRVVDVITVRALLDRNLQLPPETSISEEELNQLFLEIIKKMILDKFPDTKVDFSLYDQPYNLDTNPFALTWNFCLGQTRAGSKQFFIQYTRRRKNDLIHALSNYTARFGVGNADEISKTAAGDPYSYDPLTLQSPCGNGAYLGPYFKSENKDALIKDITKIMEDNKKIENIIGDMDLSDEEHDFARRYSEILKSHKDTQ